MTLFKKKRVRDEKFLQAIRSISCLACGRSPQSDAHHVRSKGAGGGDDFWNVIPLCCDHHTLGPDAWHRVGVQEFLKRFPHIKDHLVLLGWETDLMINKNERR